MTATLAGSIAAGSLSQLLRTVDPAVAAKDHIAVLTCFCFDEGRVLAYDDVVAIEQPHEQAMPITGAMKARLLMSFLNSVNGDVAFKIEDNEVTLSCSRSRITLPLISLADYRAVFPDVPVEGAMEIDISPEQVQNAEGKPIYSRSRLVSAIQACMPTLGYDTNHTWALGICLEFREDSAIVYSSDADATTRVEVPGLPVPQELVGQSFNIPPRFCLLLDQFVNEEAPTKMLLSADWVQIVFTSGRRLFSRTVPDTDVTRLHDIYAAVDENVLQNGNNTIPEGLVTTLDRSLIVLGALPEVDRTCSMVVHADGVINFDALSSSGRVEDELTLVEGVGPELSLKVKPEALKKCLPGTTIMSFCPQYIVLRNGTELTRLVITCNQ